MNRIDQKMQELKMKHQSAFIGFLTAGDPDIPTCLACLKQLEDNGCDIIEIGLPFSDPIAEGPLIQAANQRALANNITTNDVLEMVKTFRSQSDIPLLFLLYYNQIFTYGIEKFLKACHEAGIDGLIIPDLPFEHREEIVPFADVYDIDIISLVTPVSKQRKQEIVSNSKGFLYCVTSTGVTGERSSFKTDLKAFIDELNQYTDTPKALGFGISTPEQVKEMKDYADGIIVGSAIVRRIEAITTQNKTPEDVGAFVKSLSDACHA